MRKGKFEGGGWFSFRKKGCLLTSISRMFSGTP